MKLARQKKPSSGSTHGKSPDRRLRVWPELDRGRARPAFVHVDLGEPARGELPDRRRAVDVRDDLVVDVLGEIEVPAHLDRVDCALLVRERPCQDRDPVPLDLAHDQVASRLELQGGELLRLTVNLAPVGDADVRVEVEAHRVAALDDLVTEVEPGAEHDVALVRAADEIGVRHPIDVRQNDVANRLERRRQQPGDRCWIGSPAQRQDRHVPEAERKRRDERARPTGTRTARPTTLSASRRWSCGWAPRQCSATCVPRDCGPVDVETEPGPRRNRGVAVDDFEAGAEQLVERVEPELRGHVLETGTMDVGERRGEVNVHVGVHMGGDFEALGRCKCGNRHELPDAADHGCVATNHVDRRTSR